MLTIICGEDTIASRAAYNKLRDQYKKTGYEITHIAGPDVLEMKKWLAESPMLFAPKVAYVSEYLIKYAKSRKDKALYQDIDTLAANPDIVWIDWEKFTAREITGTKNATILEHKPADSIFALLDSFYPGNLRQVIRLMDAVSATQDEGFIFAMLARHIRTLILVSQHNTPPGMQSWQIKKIQGQASRWKPEKLLLFYDGLSRIDRTLKTSANTHGMKKSLDILACYVL